MLMIILRVLSCWEVIFIGILTAVVIPFIFYVAPFKQFRVSGHHHSGNSHRTKKSTSSLPVGWATSDE